MNHLGGSLETSLSSLLSHTDGVSAVQKPFFVFKMKEIFYVKGNSMVHRKKLLLLRDVLQVEAIWKSCFYVLVGTTFVTYIDLISHFTLSGCIAPCNDVSFLHFGKISNIHRFMIFNFVSTEDFTPSRTCQS